MVINNLHKCRHRLRLVAVNNHNNNHEKAILSFSKTFGSCPNGMDGVRWLIWTCSLHLCTISIIIGASCPLLARVWWNWCLCFLPFGCRCFCLPLWTGKNWQNAQMKQPVMRTFVTTLLTRYTCVMPVWNSFVEDFLFDESHATFFSIKLITPFLARLSHFQERHCGTLSLFSIASSLYAMGCLQYGAFYKW